MDFPFLLALFLGFKHSFDPDHLIVVSNFLPNAKNLISAIQLSTAWAVGHMLTAGMVTLILFLFKETLLSSILAYSEFLVALMLIGLGLFSLHSLFFSKKKDSSHVHLNETTHAHFFDPRTHIHGNMLGVGLIHGLASNDELLLLLTVTLTFNSFWSVLLGTLVFSVGVVLGMVLFAIVLTLPLLKIHSQRIQTRVLLITALLSILYGLLSLVTVL